MYPGRCQSDLSKKVMSHSHELKRELKYSQSMASLRDPKQGWGEGDGTPLQYSCLENPMDGGAWWAAVHGVAKSQT